MFFRPLVITVLFITSFTLYGAKKEGVVKPISPWSFNLTAYVWLPGVNGNFSAGPYTKSIDSSFIDIAGKLSNFPVAFMGHFEAHYDRLGFYMDGNYIGLDFKPKNVHGVNLGLSTQLGIMDYGVMYRLFGPTAPERVNDWNKKERSYLFDVYTGGRSIFLGNQINASLGSYSANATSSKTFTVPTVGGRVIVDLTSKWFILVDGNIGGFGLNNVNFTSSGLGALGYRTSLTDIPLSVEAGYKALNIDIDKSVAAANVTLNGPFLGVTGYW